MRVSVFLVLLIAQFAFAAENATENCEVPAYEQITTEDITRLVNKPCSFSLKTLVASLPVQMRDSPVFVKRSLSLMHRCFDSNNPRVIYSAPKLVFAVPWRATFDPTCQIVEAIGKGKKSGLNPTLIVYRKSVASIYAEGKGCAGCHTPDFKPRWEIYPYKPGMNWTSFRTDPIGTMDDNVKIGGRDFSILSKLYSDAKLRGVTNWFGPRMHYLDRNIVRLFALKASFKTDDVEDLRAKYETIEGMHLPFTMTFLDDHTSILNWDSYKSHDFGSRPNLKLGVILGELNAERIADRIFNTVPRADIEAELTRDKVCYFPYSAQVAPHLMKLFSPAKLSQSDLVLGQKSSEFFYNGYMTHQEVVIRALLKRIGTAYNFQCGNFLENN